MKNILLVCAAGMSTSMLVNKMEEAAKNKEDEIRINATSGGELEKYVEDADVLLLGPQVSYLLNDYKDKYANIPVEVINSVDYGTMNGQKVLDWALNLIEK
ncbi:PTS system lactose/cellobiose-specific family transporter subunit IIB [Gracilibacillus halophilus YIM-C55.5]|uniref:PTS system lactose/cellobiose-specific family transporter subunit IIB n=1 Tax=Gracilibacillus halophilus YIM-C55.5 TaxID=1308866 RepID=N4WC64_9BACI|nr:PTS sugar transporter subunit IIB [Gracilibacillus halophilus]ENH96844.1 PTS system lactose/cellobiose-specific family transporter subunit IIB [Gracilibacillus halophilus YIM-C55.5]